MAQQVREDLRRQMVSGRLAAGTRLPSEPECCAIYHVSRPVIREAYRLLEQEGLVEVRRGIGRFVSPTAKVMVQGSINLSRSTTELLAAQGYDPEIHLVGVDERPPSPEETDAFGIGESDPVLEVRRAYVGNGELLSYAVNIFDPRGLPKPVEEIDWTCSVAQLYAGVGRHFTTAITDISASLLPDSVVARYDVPAGVAWLLSDGPLYDQHGKPMWWSHELCRGDVRTLRVVNRPTQSG